MSMEKVKIAEFGEYTAYRGKLGQGDARSAFVTGPTTAGRIAPLQSFWCEQDAINYINRKRREGT